MSTTKRAYRIGHRTGSYSSSSYPFFVETSETVNLLGQYIAWDRVDVFITVDEAEEYIKDKIKQRSDGRIGKIYT